MREDRYFIAGRAISVSLVHGGPPPCFFSKTLFSCIVEGPDACRPQLEDIADTEFFSKLKQVGQKCFCCQNQQYCSWFLNYQRGLYSNIAVSLFHCNSLTQISEAQTLEELKQLTEPLTDYLSTAGCLRPLTRLADKDKLLEDVLTFQVVQRVRGPLDWYVLSQCKYVFFPVIRLIHKKNVV